MTGQYVVSVFCCTCVFLSSVPLFVLFHFFSLLFSSLLFSSPLLSSLLFSFLFFSFVFFSFLFFFLFSFLLSFFFSFFPSCFLSYPHTSLFIDSLFLFCLISFEFFFVLRCAFFGRACRQANCVHEWLICKNLPMFFFERGVVA